DNDITPLPDEKIDFLKPIEEDSVEEEEILDLLPKEDIDDKIDLLPDEESEIVFLTDEKEDDSASNNDINLLPDEEIDFLKPTEKEEVKEDEAAEEENEEYLAPSDESIFIDTEKNSKILGISKEDYSEFLDEFIDKAIEQEEAVKDIESTEHHKATLSLYKLAQMLHLSTLSEILEKAEGASGEKEKRAIEAFYLTLSNLTTLETEPDDTVSELEEEVYDNQICILTLDDIKPIHFDFQLEKASEDLSLPVDLIEEFVNDFIIQAHEEKINFMDACKKGDIDEIHRIGHKLKGVASNLRINPLADTLEEIQFCEDRSRFEPLLKKYWGQFLAFELYMHQISHHEGSN
ncbi:MAG: Hpt domain-containing protein, partial [Campylobacterota bacterium]|nr:Hpt domain-containing protein [Campylobacterota bacterium]